MKRTLLAAIALFCSYLSFAQSELIVQNANNELFIHHTVSPKENFYSVGRLYNVSPKDIASLNGLDMNNGLNIGQTIKIPLNASNFSQTAAKGTPVYYVVGDKEGLYRVSLRNNNVLMANLRKWNNLSNDNIAVGQKLIVGYLNATGLPAQPSGNPTAADVAKVETPVVKQEPKATPAQDPPAKKVEPQAPVVSRNEPKATNTGSGGTAVQTVAISGAGYFKSQFDLQAKAIPVTKDQTVTAGIFKTNSGWQDAKYYALMDGVEPGTIIKVVNPSNSKAIYAKVLGEMSGIRQNQGLEVRISNAAASALEVNETDKFIVKVNY